MMNGMKFAYVYQKKEEGKNESKSRNRNSFPSLKEYPQSTVVISLFFFSLFKINHLI